VSEKLAAQKQDIISQAQSTLHQEAEKQTAKLQAQIAPTLTETEQTAKTWQTVGKVVAGAVIVGVGYWIYRSSKGKG
jgi:hypothetical protein